MISDDNLEAIDSQLSKLGLLEDIDLKTASYERVKSKSQDQFGGENVTVAVRCRPSLGEPQSESCVKVDENNKSVELNKRSFYFDVVFGQQSDNERVYMRSARGLTEFAFKGYNCTVFLYGQTGTGKTYTHSSLTQSTFDHLFSLIKDSNQQSRFLIKASYYELYNENIRDLLSKNDRPLELHETKSRGVYIKDLSCYLVNNPNELARLKQRGDKMRATAATQMNEHSSRSHSIFSITIETFAGSYTNNENKLVKRNEKNSAPSSDSVRVGRILLIDLAGSERQSKSGSTGTRFKEASRINLSLTCLSLVIRALTDSKSSHIPYRNSKLTRLLSSSLGGNSKTLLISCISPDPSSLDESLNTLRFTSRTKLVKNTAKVNEDAKDALLKSYRRQVEELRHKLKAKQNITSNNESESSQMSEEDAIRSLVISNDPAKQNSNDLVKQLRLLHAKIMVGGENLLDKVDLHDRLLEANRIELEEKKQEELRLKRQLEKQSQEIELVTKTKGGLESQAVDLSNKLKRALILYKKTKEEQQDLISEHQQLKESLLQSIQATSKEIQYADCIIEDFIPRDHLDLINSYSQYDEESEEWQIRYIALSGNNIAQTKRLADRAPAHKF